MRTTLCLLLCVFAFHASAAASGTTGVKTGHAAVRGLKLYYEVSGSGPALLLVHGGPSDSRRFETLAPVLAKTFTVITVDCRGRGRSTDLDEPYTYAAMADDLISVLDGLKVPKVHVVGWSDGGILGLELAMRYGDRVDRIIAFGANFRAEGVEDKAREWARTLPDSWKDDGSYAKVAPKPEHWPVMLGRLKQLWETHQYTAEQLRAVHAPTLIAAGDHDTINLDHTIALYRALPNAELLIMPGAGHSLRDQDAVIVTQAIAKFLTKPTPK